MEMPPVWWRVGTLLSAAFGTLQGWTENKQAAPETGATQVMTPFGGHGRDPPVGQAALQPTERVPSPSAVPTGTVADVYANGGSFLALSASSGFSSVEVLDLAAAGAELKGFVGGFSDATYGYVVPFRNSYVDEFNFFGKVARFDLATFRKITVLDLTQTDPDLKGFHGGFSDATYGYVVPYANGREHFGKVARFRLATFGGVEVLDLTVDNYHFRGFDGGFSDAAYGYLIPYHNGDIFFGEVARFDLATFCIADGLDLSETDTNLAGFKGGFCDSRHGYLVPYFNGHGHFGKVVRFDLATFSSVEVLNLAKVDSDLLGFHGGFSDDTYGYVVPFYNGHAHLHNGKVARFDLKTFETVETLDLTTTDGDLMGFKGGFSDAVYGYVLPLHTEEDHSGKVARFDLATFSGVAVLDLAATDSDLKGFQGGFNSGRYGYVVPCQNGITPFGKVARFGLSMRAPGAYSLPPLGQARLPGRHIASLVCAIVVFALGLCAVVLHGCRGKPGTSGLPGAAASAGDVEMS